jgi:uncharacterized ion transporter superfamily protein YfcC
MDKDSDASIAIGKKAFISSLAILLALILASGVMTRVVPAGAYRREIVDGKVVIDVDSFEYVELPPPPIWRWFTAPIEVLWSPEGSMVIAIIILFLTTGGSISVLNECSVFNSIISKVVKGHENHKYRLLAVTVLVIMSISACTGLMDEVVFLVPIMLPLAYSLGWDSFIGLGISLLAMGFGFSAAMINPFTIGVAQRIADVPLFSGIWFRALVYVSVYSILAAFLVHHAKRIDGTLLSQTTITSKPAFEEHVADDRRLAKASSWFVWTIGIMLALSLASAFIRSLSNYALPIIAAFFLIGGVGAGIATGKSAKELGSMFLRGIVGMSPGIVLMLMAAGCKHIIATSGILDTIIYSAAVAMEGMSPYYAIATMYALVLFMNFFVPSASAKAMIMMPILAPLSDIVGLTRQMTVLAFQFGDGFSNMLYPTNPLTLVSLGLAGISYPDWFKWTIPLQLIILALTLAFLFLAVAVGLGPV